MTETLAKEYLLKKNFVVDIQNCSDDGLFLNASIHNPNNDYAYSFNISTSPHTICYYGDVGSFIFRGLSKVNALEYFRDSNVDYRTYSHFVAPSEIIETFNYDVSVESIKNFFIDNWDIDKSKIKRCSSDTDFIVLLKEYTKDNLNGKLGNFTSRTKIIELYNDLIGNCEDEEESAMYSNLWRYFNLEDYSEDIQTKDWNVQYALCCENLHYYADLILDKKRDFLASQVEELFH